MKIITGMHRSGTSCVANLLLEMGLDLGERSSLLPGDEWNERGYFEDPDVTFLNESLILGEGAPTRQIYMSERGRRSVWNKVRLTVARMQYALGSPRRRIERRARRKSAEIARIAERVRGLAVKDVRFSLTLGVWLEHAQVEAIAYCFRHPFEVAMSMKARNALPVWLGYRFWRRHVEEFFRLAAGRPAVLINYNNLFSEETKHTEMKRLFAFASLPFDALRSREVLEKVVEAGLRHKRGAGKALPAQIARTYNGLLEQHARFSEPRPLGAVLS